MNIDKGIMIIVAVACIVVVTIAVMIAFGFVK